MPGSYRTPVKVLCTKSDFCCRLTDPPAAPWMNALARFTPSTFASKKKESVRSPGLCPATASTSERPEIKPRDLECLKLYWMGAAYLPYAS